MVSAKNQVKKHKVKKPGENPLYARIIIITVLVLLGIVTAYPFINVLAKSLSESHAMWEYPMMIWPHNFCLDAYEYIIGTPMINKAFMTSVIVTVVGTFLNVCFTVTTAYSLSRIHVPGSKVMLWYVVIPMLFGGGLIPFYILLKNLGMLDTIWALIIPGLIAPANVILIRNFFWSIPDSLSEAAIIDGASEFQVLTRIILPLSKASIASIALFYAVGHWNDYFSGLMYINDNTKWPLQVLLKSIIIDMSSLAMKGGNTTALNELGKVKLQPENIRNAVIIYSTVPILMIYPFIQKHFTKGIIVGAVKQ